MSDKDARPLGGWLRAAYEPGAGCPPPERYLEAEMGELPAEERRLLEEHARTCPACNAEQELARLFHGAPEEAGVEAEGLAHVVARLEEASPVRTAEPRIERGKVVPFPARSPQPAQPAQPAAAPVRKASPVRSWRLAAAAVLALTGGLTLWTLRPTTAPLPAPPGESQVFRGGELEAVSPRGEMENAPTELHWEERAGSNSYRVRLSTIDDAVLWEEVVTAPPARLPQEVAARLDRAVVYFWTVEALDAAGARLGVSEPVRFRIRPEPETSQ